MSSEDYTSDSSDDEVPLAVVLNKHLTAAARSQGAVSAEADQPGPSHLYENTGVSAQVTPKGSSASRVSILL